MQLCVVGTNGHLHLQDFSYEDVVHQSEQGCRILVVLMGLVKTAEWGGGGKTEKLGEKILFRLPCL